MQTQITCTSYRGGTSQGAVFLASDLPVDEPTRDRVLLRVMGSPHNRQIDGIGGGDTLTSKVAIVSKSARGDADVDYLFAQVAVDKALVDASVSCGNLLSVVGPFAIETGLVAARHPETRVRIHDVNTDSLVEAVVQTPHQQVCYDGDTAIDGVPGTAAPILLNYLHLVGTKTGALLPTGSPREVIEGIQVTCMDVAVPMVIMAATSLGKQGGETPAELNADGALLARLESVRRAAARRMGLGDVKDKVMPKVALISVPAGGSGIRSRYFVPHKCHAAHAVTGAICAACCAVLRGSVADGLAQVGRLPRERVIVEHPAGTLVIDLQTESQGSALVVQQASLLRTARPLFQGSVLIPSSVWTPGRAPLSAPARATA